MIAHNVPPAPQMNRERGNIGAHGAKNAAAIALHFVPAHAASSKAQRRIFFFGFGVRRSSFD